MLIELNFYIKPNVSINQSFHLTDGSGTRRVVQILSQLGVTMVSEDPETYDIHADLVGGWPRIVEPVLEVIIPYYLILFQY